MAALAQSPWQCSTCTFVNTPAKTLCEMCGSARASSVAAPPLSLSLSAPPPPAPPAVQQQPPPPPPPMQPLMRITVRSTAHPRGWLLPFPHSYGELLDAAHKCVAPSDQWAIRSALQLFVNRGRITATTFHLLRDRDVLDALYIPPPTGSSSSPAVSSDAAAVATVSTASQLTQPTPSRKRPAHVADLNDAYRTSPNGIRYDHAADNSQPRNQPYLRPPSPPAAVLADHEMPPLSPDRPSATASTSVDAGGTRLANGGSAAKVRARQEIVVDEAMDGETESKAPPAPGGPSTAATTVAAVGASPAKSPPPAPKQEQPSPTPPPPPPSQQANSASTSSSPPARTDSAKAAALAPPTRSQLTTRRVAH